MFFTLIRARLQMKTMHYLKVLPGLEALNLTRGAAVK
jgi:hypothetical protein